MKNLAGSRFWAWVGRLAVIRWVAGKLATLRQQYDHQEAAATNLLHLLEQAQKDWLHAQNYYDNVTDHDLIDYAAFLIKATEKKYNYLLKVARREGICFYQVLSCDDSK